MTSPSIQGDESWAKAWLCAHIPELRRAAVESGWRPALDRAVAEVNQGGSASEALSQLGYDPATGGTRGGGSVGVLSVWNPVQLNGEFRCPRTAERCDRVDRRDARGAWPLCHLYSTPLKATPAHSAE